MTAGSPLAADPAVVRAFVERLHAHAAAAFADVHQPGMIQLVRIHPASEDTIATRFAIGEVDHMAEEAVRQANAGYNVYVEARTVRKDADKRGSISDTVGVFGFVNDADADKGKAGRLDVEPSLVVETSPGNFHHWLLLDRAIPADAARSLGAAIRAKAGADAASGVLTQPYRIPGTPNFPGKRKLARGRVATQTGIVSLNGKVWALDELRAAFPEVKRQARAASDRETGPSGQTSATVEAIVAETDAPDRSERFFEAVRAALAEGLTPGDVETLMRQHPDGCAGKYLEPYDRLRREIERAWDKVETQAEEVRQKAENPTYADTAGPIAAARQAVTDAVRKFIDAAVAHNLTGDEEAEPPVHALAVTTGVGKTFATAKALAEYIKTRTGNLRKRRAILYAVPTHRLGDEIERQFAAHGVTARVFRGRQAEDPNRPGETMCDDLEAVDIALSLGEQIERSCCKLKEGVATLHQCQHFNTCAYQAQKADRPDVWIVAHQMLFKTQPALGKVEMVVVDEGFWQSGLRIPKRGIALDELRANLPFTGSSKDYLHNDIEVYRGRLARALIAQDGTDGPGGVRREHLVKAGLTGQLCTTAIDAEWSLKGKATIYPGMPRAERRHAAKVATHAKHVRGYVGIWKGARELLYAEDAETSGRLYIEERDDGEGRVLIVKARSLKAVATAWRVPTMLLDATMPSADILRAYYPQVEIPEPVEAAMLHVDVRQVLGAPVAARKLRVEEDGANRNLRAIRREILRRYVELGRGSLLVIAQKAAADWLRGSGLPAGVSVEHFNNVAGLDRYRDVRGLMVIGRTIPAPVAVEALAGALTGREGALIPKGEWYGKAVRGIRTRSGAPAGMECDAHPDQVAEACRWQICEGELMQAIGRARGVNRTPDTPLAIDVLANVCLPLTVSEVVNWSPPGEEFEMLAEGIVLESAADMSTAWPDVWPTDGAARVWLHRHTRGAGNTVTDPYKNYLYIGLGNGVRRFRYQRAGRNQKWRAGAFDPATLADPRAWLESRLGPIAGFSLETAEQAPAAPAGPRAADLAPDLVALYRLAAERTAVPMHRGGTPAEVTRMPRPAASAPIVFPTAIAGRLKLMRAAEALSRRPVAETVQ